MNHYVAHIASREAYQLAEGPVWDEASERILWVDIAAGNVHEGLLHGSCVESTACYHVDKTAGAVVPARSSGAAFLVAGHQALYRLTATGEATKLTQLIPPDEPRRLNDGACDPAGRFLVGTLPLGEPTHDESLYQVGVSTGASVIDNDLSLSNGIAWSPEGDLLYTVDTIPGTVWARSYDPRSGHCGGRSQAFRIRDGSPDGLCIDTEGNLWVAIWGRGEVRCFSPSGTLLATVSVAAPHTSSVAFVGPNRDQLLITTAWDELTAPELAEHPGSGHLFLADVAATGVPTFPSS